MLCPLESIILYYMIQICKNGIYTDITINELYNLINIYSKAFNNSIDGHDNCLCKELFKFSKTESNSKIEHMKKLIR